MTGATKTDVAVFRCFDITSHADCAVCAHNMASGIRRLCHECSRENTRAGWCVIAVMLILVAVVVAYVGSNLLEDVRTETNTVNEVEPDTRARGHRLLRNGRKRLVNIFPVSAVRIVVVVLEIITQVQLYKLIFMLSFWRWRMFILRPKTAILTYHLALRYSSIATTAAYVLV